MSRWYYLEKGRPTGPVDAAKIAEKIKAGELKPHDLVYQEAGTKWDELRHIVTFQDAFPKTTASQAPGPEKQALWVLLSRKVDGSGYKQKGPYSTEEIRALLRSGEVSYTDYVWREGFKEWYKIVALPEFHTPEPNPVVRPPAPKFDTPDFPDSVIIKGFDPATGIINREVEATEIFPIEKTEILPPDEVSEKSEITMDGTSVSEVTEHAVVAPVPATAKSHKKHRDLKVPESEKTEEEPMVRRHIRKGKRHSSREAKGARIDPLAYFLSMGLVKKALVGVVVVAGTLVAIFGTSIFSSYLDIKKLKFKRPSLKMLEPNVKSVAREEQPRVDERPDVAVGIPKDSSKRGAAPVVEVEPTPRPTAAPVLPRVPPTYLRVAVVGDGGPEATLQVQTDASSHFDVTLKFTAEAGRALGYKSWARQVTLKKGERSYIMRGPEFPSGYITVRAEVHDKREETNFELGTSAPEFKDAFFKHRKMLAFEHQRERRDYIKTSGRIEGLAWQLHQAIGNRPSASSWKSFLKTWRKNLDRIKNDNLRNVSSKTRKNFVHADKWLDLKSKRDELIRLSQTANKAVLAKKPDEAMAPAKELAQSIARLKEDMLQASLWR